MNSVEPVFANCNHNHAACIQAALERAEKHCREQDLRLTAIRRRILELIWTSHRPSKAYDLLQTISQERGGAAPPTVYRALDFLLDAGLVHRIESLNAFIGCAEEHAHGQPKFLICNECARVAEIVAPEVDSAIRRETSRLGFAAIQKTIEISGICNQCAA
ncbi:MAG TPA: Fur family transcriptional regulator [Salinisphaeraceae bacterium]|nr:Fur family transcriptional regulator [Salinisphaeraceae bacterium]